MIDPFDSYKLYNALKLHFETDGHDAIKYNYKSNVSAQSFFKRRDKYFFAKLAKNYEKDLLTYFVSNFKNGVGYIGDMINEDGQKNYLDHKRIQESIHRVFSIDINKLNEQGELFDNIFKRGFGDFSSDKKTNAYRRGGQADHQVENGHDTKVDRVHTNSDGDF